ncbi:MATE family efflux transporter [Leptolyngbyaceae cyanobacterium CCMR0082]|uniref:Probable multidrug resistance protein NorM n=2 Tax=Adonisia turfae TaxID=2950184 RepID=A0A6M0S333_9CYAN|nr:MATE family efflux transporter [Adonisia turfae]NEZ56551.1 MATE family efflux transporter [Adonisia turfae CCMR0081]NEZ62463.1 MATE family efflux transporter [Adonisia turfae CCMR0082]
MPPFNTLPRWVSSLRTEAKASLRLAIPLMLIQLSEGAVNFVDSLMMGGLGTATLAAGGLGATVFWMLLSLCTGLLEMTGAIAAEAHGARDHHRVSRINVQGLWLSFSISLPMMVLIWHMDVILRLLGQQAATVDGAIAYLHAIVWGLPAALGVFVFKEILTALSRPRLVVLLMGLSIPLNIGLNYGLMYGKWGLPKLGLAGIGWASTVIFWCSFGVAVVLLKVYPSLRRLRLFRQWWRCDRNILTEIIHLGWPLCVDYGTEMGALTAAALLMGLWSTELLAAHRIVMTTTELLLMFSWGFAYAAAMRTGHKIGAGAPRGARQVAHANLLMNLVLVMVLAIPLWFLPQTIASFYLDVNLPENTETVTIAATLFKVGVVFQIAQGIRLISAGTLQGLKDTHLLATVDVLAHWGVGIGLGYVIGQLLGWQGIGLWWSLTFGQLIAAIVLTQRFQQLISVRIPCISPQK